MTFVEALSKLPGGMVMPRVLLIWRSGESFCGAGLRFRGFFFAVLGRRDGFERAQEPGGDCGYFIDGDEESLFVGLRRLVEAADLAHELQRGGADFFVG